MTEDYNATGAAGREALETLRRMLLDDDIADAARVSAAKALLDRFLPKEDTERERREAEERATAIAEARCLLAEFAAAKSAGLCEPVAVAQIRKAGADHAGPVSAECSET